MSVQRYSAYLKDLGVHQPPSLHDVVKASDYDSIAANSVAHAWRADAAEACVQALQAIIDRAHFELSLEDVNPDDNRAAVLAILKPTGSETTGIPKSEGVVNFGSAVCQHDRTRPAPTLHWMGSSMDPKANTHLFRCAICQHSFDFPIGHTQSATSEPNGAQP